MLFRSVFVIMLCDGLFPSARSLDIPDAEEEERRLFYVACTRAREQLVVTAVASPDDDGEQPSRLLDELGVGDDFAPVVGGVAGVGVVAGAGMSRLARPGRPTPGGGENPGQMRTTLLAVEVVLLSNRVPS